MMDEMAIRKHVEWHGRNYRGLLDIGNGINESDSLPIARNALVFIVVAINRTWKVPCANFLVNGLDGKE